MKESRYKFDPSECEISATRSSGPGGQHVNRVSSGILLKFNIQASSLPDGVKGRLVHLPDSRISKEGVITIKATSFRSRMKNRKDALERLDELVSSAWDKPKKRKRTKPPKKAREKRLQEKTRKAAIKEMRKKPSGDTGSVT